ncbi:MAG: hypothetical protein ACREHG_06720 [Candidatus Saccharimonadales bacterium]
MKLDSLDNIVRSTILTNGLTIHWYFDFLHSGIRCLRELNLDILKNVISVKLTIDINGNVALPCDYVDYVMIGFPAGQMVSRMSKDDKINSLPNRDSNGQIIPYRTTPVGYPYDAVDILSLGYYYWYFNSFNTYYENTGGLYGFKGYDQNTFKILPNQNRIQFNQNFCGSTVYMDYISDGFDTSCCSCATMVNIYAVDAIQKYITTDYYRSNPQKAKLILLAKQEYDLAVERLIARMNPITIADIRAAFRKGYVASPKTY